VPQYFVLWLFANTNNIISSAIIMNSKNATSRERCPTRPTTAASIRLETRNAGRSKSATATTVSATAKCHKYFNCLKSSVLKTLKRLSQQTTVYTSFWQMRCSLLVHGTGSESSVSGGKLGGGRNQCRKRRYTSIEVPMPIPTPKTATLYSILVAFTAKSFFKHKSVTLLSRGQCQVSSPRSTQFDSSKTNTDI
jgi:hypothetical protein